MDEMNEIETVLLIANTHKNWNDDNENRMPDITNEEEE